MKHIEGNFEGVRNVNIYYQGWLPETDVKAVLLVVHGLVPFRCRCRFRFFRAMPVPVGHRPGISSPENR